MPRFHSPAVGSGSNANPFSSQIASAQPAHPKPAPDGSDVAPLPQQAPGKEEPDLVLEPDIASDGRDEEGEAMIRDLPQRLELSESPGQPDSNPPR